MDDKLSSILSYLDITGETGLASKDNFDSLTTYQKLFYNQVKSKIGVDAVYFLRDEEGVAKNRNGKRNTTLQSCTNGTNWTSI